ncbi:hypothetical protein TraAM80_05425 [Trypanosoma rangeli]|uniref:Uncharacterized protein n=1 Tax=Trypanosoma rangeli TaxID=5698 RepID=A0A3R7MKC3_TRYRA|nr:uncharacterized protein TraAM80_05425 [Trypanosoma rangeli]RNF04073.1 hypothetical protein TraAM80_05425 [Trypanosoma rangeli]|eukprot:RNF04073.1 hypothetical protein TraAM80_05425 [Trypanosoma rangeli]
MRCSLAVRKVTKVPTRSVVLADALRYHPRYSVSRKMVLSNSFNSVDEKNRFISLQLLLEKLSGHVGRRQYKMMCDFTPHFDKLKEEGIDWHELKWLNRTELIDLFDNVLALSRTERAVLLAAIEAKTCGVLRRSDTRHSTSICVNRGVAEHGWRCGLYGHTSDVYFEGKAKANPAALQLYHRSSVRSVERSGVRVEVRTAPDFSVVGRFDHSLSPRVWSTPDNPVFQVSTIGYEFRVHPEDPRVVPQIEAAAQEWELHAAVTQQVLWEMLEMYAVERNPQPLELKLGEMGAPDCPSAYSSAFTVRDESTDEVADKQAARTEQRMLSADGREMPWFREPLPQQFENGIPIILPYAPSIVVKSSFRQVTRSSPADVERQLLQPVVDITCFVHPQACFWWSEEDEERCLNHIVEYAKRIPYALPFNLYLRVDTTKNFRGVPDRVEEMRKRLEEKSHYFNPRRFREVIANHPKK